MTLPLSIDQYVEGVLAGDRTVLARAITLIESRRADHKGAAHEVLTRLLPYTGKADRIGVTGSPGVGKSTFIESFGTWLTEQGHKLAVLAIDPTSTRSGGSILGDKTRMTRLAQDGNAFIRPSPSAGTLGGVARATREAMALCEAAGYDVILIETVGVGQSETVVAEMVDFFLVLMLPGAGDELQGIKKGLIELADLIAVNKADGETKNKASQAAASYRAAMHIITPKDVDWEPPVLTCSALERKGLDEIWAKIREHRVRGEASGTFEAKRSAQRLRWMWAMVEDRLMNAFQNDPAVRKRLNSLADDVREGRLPASAAADTLLEAFGAGSKP